MRIKSLSKVDDKKRKRYYKKWANKVEKLFKDVK